MRARVGDGIVIAAVEHLGIRQVGFWIIVVGLSVGVVALVVLHLVGTGLAPLKNAVSQYGISSYKTGYRAQTLAYATAGIGAAIGVASLRTTDVAFCGLCVIFAASRAVISWFPMDEPGADRTATGRRHGLLAFAAFAAANVAAGSLPSVVRNNSGPSVAAHLSELAAIAMLASFLAMGAARRSGGELFGLAERSFYVFMTLWLVAVAILLHP
jgi:hypothetical protein